MAIVKAKLENLLGLTSVNIDTNSTTIVAARAPICGYLTISWDTDVACLHVAKLYNKWANSKQFNAGSPDMPILHNWLQQKGLESVLSNQTDVQALRFLDMLRVISTPKATDIDPTT